MLIKLIYNYYVIDILTEKKKGFYRKSSALKYIKNDPNKLLYRRGL